MCSAAVAKPIPGPRPIRATPKSSCSKQVQALARQGPRQPAGARRRAALRRRPRRHRRPPRRRSSRRRRRRPRSRPPAALPSSPASLRSRAPTGGSRPTCTVSCSSTPPTTISGRRADHLRLPALAPAPAGHAAHAATFPPGPTSAAPASASTARQFGDWEYNILYEFEAPARGRGPIRRALGCDAPQAVPRPDRRLRAVSSGWRRPEVDQRRAYFLERPAVARHRAQPGRRRTSAKAAEVWARGRLGGTPTSSRSPGRVIGVVVNSQATGVAQRASKNNQLGFIGKPGSSPLQDR